MKRKVTISSENISPKQWSVLLLELNIMQKAWGPYAKLNIEAPDFERVIKWGTRRYDAREE
tara:strand:+ start:205 stop:387 length:183 start_codon:yes stop_codon:yes gene_type:complete